MDIPYSERTRIYVLTAGQAGPFDFNFPLKAAADLKVVRRRGGGDTTLVLDTHYSVTLLGSPAGSTGATVTLLAADALTNDQLILEGLRVPASQTSWAATGPFTAAMLQDLLEKQTILLQELRRDVDRAVRRHPADESTESLLLPLERDIGLGIGSDGGIVPHEGSGDGGGDFPALPLDVENGGTGADSAAEARANLEAVHASEVDDLAAAYLLAQNAEARRRLRVSLNVQSATQVDPAASPTEGQQWIIPAVGSTGAWAGKPNQLARWTSGAWEFAPAEHGWTAYVADTDLYLLFVESAWRVISSPTLASSLTTAKMWQRVASGGASGTAAAGVHNRALTVGETDIPDASVDTSGGFVSLPAGHYLAISTQSFHALSSGSIANVRPQLFNATETIVYPGATAAIVNPSSSGTGVTCGHVVPFVVTVQSNVYLQFRVVGAAGVGLGLPQSVASVQEQYAELIIVNLDALKGDAGLPGQQGPTGPNTGLDYAWDAGVTDADPGAGKARLSTQTLGASGFLYISKTDRNGGGTGAIINRWSLSTSTVRGRIRLFQLANRLKGLELEVTGGIVDGTTYWKVPIYVAFAGTAPDAAGITAIMFEGTGDRGLDGIGSLVQSRWIYTSPSGGEVGLAGPDDDGDALTYRVGWEAVYVNGVRLIRGSDYTATTGTTIGSMAALVAGDVVEVHSFIGTPSVMDTTRRWTRAPSTTMADPGTAGLFRLNHAAWASVTAMAIRYVSADIAAPNLAEWIKSFDDSTNTVRGELHFKNAAGTSEAIFNVTGTVTDNTTWGQVTLAHVASAGAPADELYFLSWSRTGNKGADGAGTGDMVAANNLSDVASKKTAYDTLSVRGADIASAGTIDLDAATGNLVDITGTTTIGTVTLADGRLRTVRFTAILTLTNSANLVLLTGADIVTAAGDIAVLRGYAGGIVRCVDYSRANGLPLAVATTADYLANTAAKALITGTAWAAAGLVTLADNTTIAVDMATFINATLTIAGNRTMGAPSNTKVGQSGIILIKQDATGSRTMAWNSVWKWAGGTAPVLTTTASRTDIVGYFVESSTIIHAWINKDSR